MPYVDIDDLFDSLGVRHAVGTFRSGYPMDYDSTRIEYGGTVGELIQALGEGAAVYYDL